MGAGKWRGALIALLGGAYAGAAGAQAVGVTAPGNIPAIGNVTAAVAGVTEFRVATGGAVSVVPGGTGTRQTAGSVANTITLTCSGGGSSNNPCNSTNVIVRVTPTTTQVGRAQAVNDLQIAMGTAVQVIAPSKVGEVVTFTIGPIGRNSSKTFRLGLDLPISGGFGASGTASSSYKVDAGFTPNLTATGSGAAIATTRNGTSVAKDSDLTFGAILPLDGQSGTVSISAANGDRASSNPNGVRLRSGDVTSRAQYSIQGEGGQILSVSVPASFSLTGPGSSITVTTTKTIGASVTISNGPGASGTALVGIGGSFPVTGPMTPGQYNASFDVVFTWN
jgi:Domain of unknown function (DUF4402)